MRNLSFKILCNNNKKNANGIKMFFINDVSRAEYVFLLLTSQWKDFEKTKSSLSEICI